jgi:class 3 adenylate cyclase
MTRENDDIQIINKIVATLDICSSSHLIEDLIKTNNMKLWRDLLIHLKEYIVSESTKHDAEAYKFIGDGWIIFFSKPYSAKKIIQLLSGINQVFEERYKEEIFPNLNTPPEISGLTFGLDEGQLIQLTMQEKPEYVGQPINIACRLQGAINEIDIKGGFRVFMSHRLFNNLRFGDHAHYNEPTERRLRNISECSNFRLYRISITDSKFKIIKAIYGTASNKIDVTYQYTRQIKNDKLDVVVSNELAENDPHRGTGKTLWIEYIHQGKEYKKEFTENSRIQLP